MKRFFCFCWSAVFGLCFLSAASNVILRNGTNSVITSIFVIEGEKPPVQQSVNLLPASKFERTLRKMQRKAEFYGEEFDEKRILLLFSPLISKLQGSVRASPLLT